MQLLRRLLLYNLLVIIIIVQCPNPKGEPEFSAIKLEFLSPIPRHPWDLTATFVFRAISADVLF